MTEQLRDQLGSEALAVAELLRRGISIGDDAMPQSHGCTLCIWHLRSDGHDLDGGSANGLLSNLESGYYGQDPKGLTLHPLGDQ